MKVVRASVSGCVLGSVSSFGPETGLNHYFYESNLVLLCPVLFVFSLLHQLVPF